MRLGTKIALLMSGLVAVFLTTLGTVDVVQDEAFLETDTTQDQAEVANILAASVERETRYHVTDSEMDDFVRAAVHREGNLRVRWGWTDEPRLGELPDLPAGTWAAVESGQRATFRVKKPYREQWTFVGGKGVDGRRFYIALGESLDRERRHLHASVLRTAEAIALLAFLCSGLMIVFGQRLVTRPVKKLVEHARAVASGDLGKRLELSQRDEIGQLATEMNAMSSQLSSSREKLASETQRRVATLEQLRHADRLTTVGKLASGLAHELGTPLNVVHGYGRLIADHEAVDAEVKGNAETIVGQADKMTRLVRQLLDFARRKGPKKEAVDVNVLATRVVSVLAPTARKKGVVLESRADAAPATVAADPTMIEQVLTNLIFNALQASAEGSGPVCVDVDIVDDVPSPTASGKYVKVCVRDHGEGISEEDLPRIFEPFFTTKDVGEGTGLGLSVSYGIIQDHGGFITVDSTVGQGSSFQIYLPLTETSLS